MTLSKRPSPKDSYVDIDEVFGDGLNSQSVYETLQSLEDNWRSLNELLARVLNGEILPPDTLHQLSSLMKIVEGDITDLTNMDWSGLEKSDELLISES